MVDNRYTGSLNLLTGNFQVDITNPAGPVMNEENALCPL
jgi:hypothetical protein